MQSLPPSHPWILSPPLWHQCICFRLSKPNSSSPSNNPRRRAEYVYGPPSRAGGADREWYGLFDNLVCFVSDVLLAFSSIPLRHMSFLLSLSPAGPPFTQPPQPQSHLAGAGAHSKPGTSTASGSSSGTGVGAMYVGHGHGHVQGQGGSQRKKARLG